jgi:uncharacterized lipoprotein YbaY
MRGAVLSLKALLLVAAGLAYGCGGNGAAPQTKILGSVTYREALVLPAGSTLEIRLEDAGRTSASGVVQSDATATPVATQTVDAGGRGSPISFTLAVPRDALVPRHKYVLRAAIRSSAGEPLFTGLPDQKPIDNPNTTGKIEVPVIPASR